MTGECRGAYVPASCRALAGRRTGAPSSTSFTLGERRTLRPRVGNGERRNRGNFRESRFQATVSARDGRRRLRLRARLTANGEPTMKASLTTFTALIGLSLIALSN